MSVTNSRAQVLAALGNFVIGYDAAKTALVDAAFARGESKPLHNLIFKAPPGVGSFFLVRALAQVMDLPFARAVQNFDTRSVDFLTDIFAKLYQSCNQDIDRVRKSVIVVEGVGRSGTSIGKKVQAELVNLIKGKTICLRPASDTAPAVELNTSDVIFVICMRVEPVPSQMDQYIKDSAGRAALAGILPELSEVVPHHIELGYLGREDELSLLNSLKR